MAILEQYFKTEGRYWESYLKMQQKLLICMKDKEYICSICHEPWQGESLALTPCQHTFHEHCLMKWHKKSRDCPLCRNDQSRAYYVEHCFEFDVYSDLSYEFFESVGFKQIYRSYHSRKRNIDIQIMSRGLCSRFSKNSNLDSILALSPMRWSTNCDGKWVSTVPAILPDRNWNINL